MLLTVVAMSSHRSIVLAADMEWLEIRRRRLSRSLPDLRIVGGDERCRSVGRIGNDASERVSVRPHPALLSVLTFNLAGTAPVNLSTTFPPLYRMNVGIALISWSAATSCSTSSSVQHFRSSLCAKGLAHLQFVDVNLCEFELREFLLHLCEMGRDQFAWTAPCRPIVDDDRLGSIYLWEATMSTLKKDCRVHVREP